MPVTADPVGGIYMKVVEAVGGIVTVKLLPSEDQFKVASEESAAS